MKRLSLFLTYFLVMLTHLAAEDITITANAPSHVEVGDQFRVQFTINTFDHSDFDAPNFKGFEVIYGPSTSRQSSTQIVNGHYSRSSSVTYTYVLLCSKAGKYTLGEATAKVDGKTIKSNTLTINVAPIGQGNNHTQQQGGTPQSSASRPTRSVGSVSNSDLFMTATVNRTNVHEQEAVLLTYKVYTLVNLTQLDGKLPSLDGFQIQELPLPRTKQFSVESYNGRNYHTVVWSQYVLFPQQTGDIEIPSLTFEGVVEQVNRAIDPVDAFFNGVSGMIELKKKIVTPKIVVHVSPLPEKPEGFSGAVGSFSISSSINGNEFKTNDAITMKVNVKGVGNMKLISTPTVNFPKDFEVYDPKVNDDFKSSSIWRCPELPVPTRFPHSISCSSMSMPMLTKPFPLNHTLSKWKRVREIQVRPSRTSQTEARLSEHSTRISASSRRGTLTQDIREGISSPPKTTG